MQNLQFGNQMAHCDVSGKLHRSKIVKARFTLEFELTDHTPARSPIKFCHRPMNGERTWSLKSSEG
jgi:hypothetical protein